MLPNVTSCTLVFTKTYTNYPLLSLGETESKKLQLTGLNLHHLWAHKACRNHQGFSMITKVKSWTSVGQVLLWVTVMSHSGIEPKSLFYSTVNRVDYKSLFHIFAHNLSVRQKKVIGSHCLKGNSIWPVPFQCFEKSKYNSN